MGRVKKMVSFHIMLPRETKRWVQQEARRQRVTDGAFMRQILARYMGTTPNPVSAPEEAANGTTNES
jgi:hypothetical protein